MAGNGQVKVTLGLDTSLASQQMLQFWGNVSKGAQQAAGGTKPVDTALQKLIDQAKRCGLEWDSTKQKFVDSRGIERSIKDATRAVKEMEEGTARAGKAVGTLKNAFAQGFKSALQGIPQGIGQAIGQRLLDPFRALGSVVGGSVEVFRSLDESLRQTLSIAGASQKTFSDLADSVSKVAGVTKFTAQEVAAVTVELARAGLNVDQIKASLPGIADAAAAAGASLSEAGNVVTIALNAFKLSAEQSIQVADVFTAASNNSAQSMKDLGDAMKYVAPIANSLGISLEDTSAVLAILANNGIKGGQAGTTLRAGLTRLAQTAAGANSEFTELSRGTGRLAETGRRLAIDMKDANGNLLPMPQLLKNLQQGFATLDSTEKSLVAKIMFGDEAGTGFVALLNSSTEEIDKMFEVTRNSSGTAAKTAKDNLSGIAGALELLKSAVGSFQATVGGVLSGALLPFVNAAKAMLDAFNQLPQPLRQGITIFASLGAAALIAAAGVVAFRTAMQQTQVAEFVAGLQALTQAFAANAAAAWTNSIAKAGQALGNFNSFMTTPLQVMPAIKDLFASSAGAVRGFIAQLAAGNLSAIWSSIASGAAKAAAGVKAFVVASIPLAATAAAAASLALVWETYSSTMRKANESTKGTEANFSKLQEEMSKLGVVITDNNSKWNQAVERVGQFQATIDRLRRMLGLTTSEEASYNQEIIKTGEAQDRLMGGLESLTAEYRKQMEAAKGNKEAEAEADQIRQRGVQVINSELSALSSRINQLEGMKVANNGLTDSQQLLLNTLKSSKTSLEAQKSILNQIAPAYLRVGAASREAGDAVSESQKEMEVATRNYQDAVKAMEQSAKNQKKAMQEAFETQTAEPLRKEIEGVEEELQQTRDAAKAAGDAMEEAAKKSQDDWEATSRAIEAANEAAIQAAQNSANAAAANLDAAMAAERQSYAAEKKSLSNEMKAVEFWAKRALAVLDEQIRKLQERADKEQQSYSNSADRVSKEARAVEKRFDAEARALEQNARAMQKAYDDEIKNLERVRNEIQRNADERVKALQQATPAEEKLNALERARLQQQALLGGEEGLRAQARLQRAERERQISEVKAQTEIQLEEAKEAIEQRRIQFEKQRDQLEQKRYELEERRRQSQEAFEARLEAIREAAAAAARRRQAELDKLEEERQKKQEEAEERKQQVQSRMADAEAEHNEKMQELEEERNEQQEAAEKEMEELKKEHAEKEKEREDQERENAKKTEEEKRDQSKRTKDQEQDLEEKLHDLKKRLKEAEKNFREDLMNFEEQVARRRVRLQNEYRDAIGQTNRYIVETGSMAWTSYANHAVAELERVRQAAVAAAAAAAAAGGGSNTAATGGHFSGGHYLDAVNEYGQEAFLSDSGDLSLINAPMWSSWRPPTSGTILPAGPTAALKAQGAFDRSDNTVSQASAGGNPITRMLQNIQGGDSVGRITNNVTIQSQAPVNDASRIMVEMSRLKARRR